MEYQQNDIALFYKYKNCLTVLASTTVVETKMSPGFPLPSFCCFSIWTLKRGAQLEFMLLMIAQIYMCKSNNQQLLVNNFSIF